MARNRNAGEQSAIVAASGMMSAVWHALRKAVLKAGGTDVQIYRLNTPEGASLIEQFAELIVGAAVKVVAQVAWPLIFQWIIAACRFTTYVNPSITAENFSPQHDDFRIKDVVTVSIDRDMSTSDVLALLDSKGLRSATLVELLWWWLTHPAEQGNCLVVALGSVWNGDSPCVRGRGEGRGLRLLTREVAWSSRCLFAAVSK